jgi:molybdopterin-guanine dinucleotide biosynthesis protein
MIIWITGQQGGGKTTLAKDLITKLNSLGLFTLHLDGDVWRSMTNNFDYSEEGRRRNVALAMRVALNADDGELMVICSFISPYRDLRESLKQYGNVLEVYVHTEERPRNNKLAAKYYECPTSHFVDICSDEPRATNVEKVMHILYQYQSLGRIDSSVTGGGLNADGSIRL